MKAALIGCGRIGSLLEDDPLRYKPCTHAGGATNAGISFSHACDINGERLEQFRSKYHVPPGNCSTDYRDLFHDQKKVPPIAIIATWTDSHCEIAEHAARNGVRAIVLEKPVCANLVQAQRLLETCRKHGTHLVVNHERRYTNRYQKARELITSGKIGDMLSINGSILTSGSFGLSEENQGGGPLLHDGTHLVDMVRFFGGEITTARGRFQRYDRDRGFEDRASAWLTTEHGMDVFLQAGGRARYFHFELDLVGTRGRIIIGNGFNRLFTTGKSKYYKGFQDLEEVPFPRFRDENCFTSLYREVKKLVNGKVPVPLSSGEDGYRALEIVHAVYLSAHRDKPVILPLAPRSVNLKTIFNTG